MPIVLSEIVEDAVQRDGRRHVTERHTDHVARQHWVHYMATSGLDVQAVAVARVPILDEQLIEHELAANAAEVVE